LLDSSRLSVSSPRIFTNARNYKHAHLDGARAVEDVGGHDRAMLGEGERKITWITVLL
jgi:hypothetical protein